MSPTGGCGAPTIADGRKDLLMTCLDGADVYLQTAQGLAAPTTLSFGTGLSDACLFDLDGDGLPDLVATGAGDDAAWRPPMASARNDTHDATPQ